MCTQDSLKICFLCADLRNVGPTRQTLNIIKYSGVKQMSVVLTLFDEPSESLLKLYLDEGVRVECLHLNRSTFVFCAVKKVKDFCKKNKIGYIHSYGVKPDIVGYFATKKMNVKHIITLRNFPMEDLTGRMNSWIGRFVALAHLYVLKRCEFLVACSKTIAKKMQETYKLRNPLTPIQNGVDTEAFKKNQLVSRKELYKMSSVNDATKIFICTNSFIPRKHNDEIAEAFNRADLKNALLVFLGDGSLLKSLKDEFKQFKNILFLGKQRNVAAYLQSANFFVSASDSEGLPNAVMESLSCGCPVILSDIPQHREIMEVLSNCGLLFPLHDVDSLKDKMKCCFDVPFADTRACMSKSQLTMEKMGASYSKYYKENCGITIITNGSFRIQ